MILVYFLSGGCVDDVVNNRTNHRAGEMDFKVGGTWNTEKYCRPPWLADKKNFRILDALQRLKQQYFDLGDSLLIDSVLKPFLFSLCLPFFFLLRKNVGGHGPPAPQVSPALNHQFTSAIVVNLMNSARVCWIIKRTVFDVYFCLDHSVRYELNQFERRDEKPRHQRKLFQNLDNFCVYLQLYVKYTLLYTKL